MSFRVFNAAQQRANIKAETLFDAPFHEILRKIPPEYLVEAVTNNFDIILGEREVYELAFFKIFPQWKKLLCENLAYILELKLRTAEDYLTFLDMYPEYAPEVYSYLLDLYVTSGESFGLNFDIIDDILVPMIDLEKWQSCYFPALHDSEKMTSLLENVWYKDFFAPFWKLLYYLENELGYDREKIEPFIQEKIIEFTNRFEEENNDCIGSFNSEDQEVLKDFFRDQEAYQYFLGQLPRLLETSGIELYTLLIKVLGPYHEIVDLYPYCAEFHLEEAQDKEIARQFLNDLDKEEDSLLTE